MSENKQISEVHISAPGKIILHGEHAVVYGKLAVAGSLNLRTKAEMKFLPTMCDYIEVEFVKFNNQIVKYSLKDINIKIFNKLRDCKVNHEILLQTAEDFLAPDGSVHLISFFYLLGLILHACPQCLKPFCLRIDSELTMSAGTGSSASYLVTLAGVFLQLQQLRRFFTEEDLNKISKWAFEAERIVHGAPSGVDNTVCTYGGLVQFRKGARPVLTALGHSVALILIDTHVQRDTKALVQRVHEWRIRDEGFVEAALEQIDKIAIKAVELFEALAATAAEDEGPLYESLSSLVETNHGLLQTLDVSHPKLEEACAIVKGFGLSAKLTGAGGGGHAFCLVPPRLRSEAEVAVTELRRRGFGATLTKLKGKGITIDVVR